VERHGWRHETNNIKRHGFRAAPAASGAGHVGRRVDRNMPYLALERIISAYDVKRLRVVLKRMP